MKRWRLLLALAAIAVAVFALARGLRAPAAKGIRPPKSASDLPTTSAEIYLGNLDGQIAELARLKDAGAATASNAQRLSAALYARARYRGDLDEIQRAIDEASSCIQLEETNGSCFLVRAEEEQSLHRFAEARADLDRAKALGARTADLEADLAWNAGRYDEAIEAIRKARRERPSSATWLREAQLDHDLGLEEDADAAFDKAEDLVRDVAPLPLAHLYVQRGIVLGERGRRDEACLFFREAIARMPGYVAARDHLAETLHAMGKDAEAIAIYEDVVKTSDDPEFMYALALLYGGVGKHAEAHDLDVKARARYEALLAKYPEAMFWHAAEFFLDTGDAKRAASLLQKNVALRPNGQSYAALARAELASGDIAKARSAIDTALATPVRSASLFWTASAVYRKSGLLPQADEFRSRALLMNPHIAEDAP